MRDRISMTIHGVNFLQSNLRDTSKTMGDRFSNVWIDLEQLSMLDTEREIRYFVGCLYQQDRSFFNALYDDEAYRQARSEEHTSELQSLMRISYAVFCLKKKKKT